MVRRYPPGLRSEPGERTARGMAEEIFKDPLSDLKELESKVGRKTPEGLLGWVRDAADRGDAALRWDAADKGERGSAPSDSISAQISHLKDEMRRLRSADVRILCQLMSVHEGIEAMRWLMEDRGALASRGSSLTGSLSSLVTVEENGAWMSPCRESPSPTCPQDLTVTTEREPERLHPSLSDDGDSNQKSNCNAINPETSEARPFRSSTSNFGVTWCKYESIAQESTKPASDLIGESLKESQSQDVEAIENPSQSIKISAKTIRRALLRSSRVRKEVTADTSSLIFTKQSEETQTAQQTKEGFRASQDITVEEDHSKPSVKKGSMYYDAQPSWMGSQDDVTFL